MSTYTNRLKLVQPDPGQCNWDWDWNRNQQINDAVDSQLMQGNFTVSGGNLTGAALLEIDIDETVVNVDGAEYTVTADTLTLVGAVANPEERNWIWIDNTGTLQVTQVHPSGSFALIGLVDTNVTVVVRQSDLRQATLEGERTGVENDVINGTLDKWQRYLGSATAISSATEQFIADRIGNYRTSGATLTIDQKEFTAGQVLVPGNPRYYHEAVFTTDSTAAEEIYHFVRVKDVEKYSGKTVAFKIHGDVGAAKDIALEITQNFGSGGSADVQVNVETISLTTTFTKNIVFITFPSISTKTIGTLSYTEFKLWLSAGSDFNANTNSLGNQSGTVNISEVEIYASNRELPVRRRTVEENYVLCLDYCRLMEVFHPVTHISGSTVVRTPKINLGVPMIQPPTLESYSSAKAINTANAEIGTTTSATINSATDLNVRFLLTGTSYDTTILTAVIDDVILSAEI